MAETYPLPRWPPQGPDGLVGGRGCSCHTEQQHPLAAKPRSERFSFREGILGNDPTLTRQSRTINPKVSTASAEPWQQARYEAALPSDQCHHNSSEVLMPHLSSLDTQEFPVGAGMPFYHGKLFHYTF